MKEPVTRDDIVAFAASILRLARRPKQKARDQRRAAAVVLKSASRGSPEWNKAFCTQWNLRQADTILDMRDDKRELSTVPRDALKKARTNKRHDVDAALLVLVDWYEKHEGPATLFIDGPAISWLVTAMWDAGAPAKATTAAAIAKRLERLRKESKAKRRGTLPFEEYVKKRPRLLLDD